MPVARPMQVRFWEKVRFSGLNDCWEWTGGISTNGYGLIKEGAPSRKMKSAHRVCYELVAGAVPSGHVVRHKCDNKKCVNPLHLETGSQSENIRDAVDRGRYVGGKVHRVLSCDQAKSVKLLLQSGCLTHREIAYRFGVKRQVVSDIARGKTYTQEGA